MMKITANKVVDVMRTITYVMILISLPILACKVLPLVERAVVVLEKVDKRIDDAVRELAPLGRAGVVKGIEAIRSVDGRQLGHDFTEAVKRKLNKK